MELYISGQNILPVPGNHENLLTAANDTDTMTYYNTWGGIDVAHLANLVLQLWRVLFIT